MSAVGLSFAYYFAIVVAHQVFASLTRNYCRCGWYARFFHDPVINTDTGIADRGGGDLSVGGIAFMERGDQGGAGGFGGGDGDVPGGGGVGGAAEFDRGGAGDLRRDWIDCGAGDWGDEFAVFAGVDTGAGAGDCGGGRILSLAVESLVGTCRDYGAGGE